MTNSGDVGISSSNGGAGNSSIGGTGSSSIGSSAGSSSSSGTPCHAHPPLLPFHM